MPDLPSTLDLDRIFPIPDAPSARLMKLKAHCLYRAGILSGTQRQAIARRADQVLSDGPARSSFPRPPYHSKAA
jgi:hypothetical protein